MDARLSSRRLHVGDADAAVVQIRAGAAFGGEHLLPDGIVDHAGDHLAGVFQPHRDIEHREAVGEVGGAVQRIDKPAVFGGALVAAALFGHDAVRGKVRAQAFDHQFFVGAIGLRHQVEFAFEFEGNAALEVIGQQRAGLAGNLHRCFQVRQPRYDSSEMYLMSCLKMNRLASPLRVRRMKD